MTLVRSLSTISGLDEDEANAVNDLEIRNTQGMARTCICTFSSLPLAVSLVYCGLFWDMWSKAREFDDKASNYTGDVSYYDTCGLGTREDGSLIQDTKWSQVFAFNAILYLV